MRYFIQLSYRGTKYSGWQTQPNAASIQQTLEEKLTKVLREKIQIVGCGRTDTGVHAKGYVAHFDFENGIPADFFKRINKSLPEDISISKLKQVKPEAHARFDATHRAYQYHIVFRKTPFHIDTAWHYPFMKEVDFDKLQEAARLLVDYQEFFPFCKTNTQVKTMRCELFRSEWEIDMDGGRMVLHVAANRFLRGMIRLIVGMCLNVATGKLDIEEVRKAMDEQTRLSRALSVPPHGLYLMDIRYPYETFRD